jgi:hypothetical protein
MEIALRNMERREAFKASILTNIIARGCILVKMSEERASVSSKS